MTRPRVLVGVRAPEGALDDYDVVPWAGGPVTEDALIAALRDVDAVLAGTNYPFTARVLANATSLKVISIHGVGFDHVDVGAARSRGVLVSHTPGVLSDAVADLTIGLVVALARRLNEVIGSARPVLGVDLRGKTLLVVGFGRIGREVAMRARAIGMAVRYHDTRSGLPRVSGARRARSLKAALREADFVSLHVDLNSSTRGLISKAELEAMRPTAYLVNTARGGVVDEAALLDALRSGGIAGAALDVLAHEPIRPDEPLLGLPNVILTPHIGSATAETRAAMMQLALDNLRSCLADGRCEYLVPEVAPPLA